MGPYKNRQLNPNTHPVTTQHPPRCVHADRCDHTGLYPQEPVVEQRHLGEELAQRARLDVVVIRLADLAPFVASDDAVCSLISLSRMAVAVKRVRAREG